MTSSPVSPSEEAIPSPHNSRPNHLPEVRFSPQPNNKISISTLFRATDVGFVCSIQRTHTFLTYRVNFSYSHRHFVKRALLVTYSSLPHLAHQKLWMSQVL